MTIFVHAILSLVIILTGTVADTSSVSRPWFKIPVLDNGTRAKIEENIDIIVSYNEPVERHRIRCFDVSDEGYYLLTFDNSSVSVYDSDFSFICNIIISSSQQLAVSSYWNSNGYLLIFLHRGLCIIELDTIGNTVEFYDYSALDIEQKNQIDDYFMQTTRNINGDKYAVYLSGLEVVSSCAYSSYTKLSKTDIDGNKTILYDAGNSKDILKGIGYLSLILLISSLSLYRLFSRERVD